MAGLGAAGRRAGVDGNAELSHNLLKLERRAWLSLAEMTASMTAPREIDHLKKYETVVSSGQSALRALLTLNGGATVAFLAFIGHTMEAGTMPVKSGRVFVGAMQLFILGTFLAVLAYGTIFLTNCLSHVGRERWSNWMFGFTLVCGLASLVFFLVASGYAIRGFELANVVLGSKPE